MTITEITAKIEELQSWEQLLEDAKVQTEAIKDELKAEMMERDTEELVADRFIIRFTKVVSNRFDTANFKKKFAELYKEWTKPVESRKFTVSA